MRFDLNHLGDYPVPESTKNGIAVDVGANCGSFGLKYANWFRKIHYYEPVKETFDICSSRLKDFKNITGFQEAVYNKDDEKVSICIHTNNDSGSCAIKNDSIIDHRKNDWTDIKSQEEVSTVSLETIFERLDNETIDYMKIDCETSEYLFLMNKDLSKIKYLGMEVHCQLGKEKWYELITHILKYFKSTNDYTYYSDFNREFIFENKNI